MLYGYIRVSTIEQDTARQRADILEAANAAGLQVAKWVEEKVSGVAKDRAVHALIEKLEEGDVIAVTELSRIGRSLREINDMVSQCRNRTGVHLDGEQRPTSGSGHGHRRGGTLVRPRHRGTDRTESYHRAHTKRGLRAARAKGIRLGRIPGASKLDNKADEIQKLLAARVSKAAVARILGVSRTTVVQWVRRHAA